MSDNNIDINDNIYYFFGLPLDQSHPDFTVDFTELCDSIDSKRKKEGQWREDKYEKHRTLFEKLKNEKTKPDKTILENLAREARKKRMSELKIQIENDEADNVLEQDEYNKTVKKFDKYFTEETINKAYRLKIYDFPIPPKPTEISAGIKPTDKSKMREINNLLKEGHCIIKMVKLTLSQIVG